MIELTKQCPLCGKLTSMVLDVEQKEIDAYMDGMVIQEAFSRLNAEEREHIKTGICSECWPSDEENEHDRWQKM